MLLFSQPDGVFTVRSAAVIHDDTRNAVLLHQATGDDFWSLPGGRCELHEPSPTCAERELAEELGAKVQVQRLLWVAETFYTPADRRHHEIAFYHLARLAEGSDLLRPDNPGPYGGREGALHLEFRWFCCSQLEHVNLYPVFLRRGLQDLPAGPRHIITYDTETAPLQPILP